MTLIWLLSWRDFVGLFSGSRLVGLIAEVLQNRIQAGPGEMPDNEVFGCFKCHSLGFPLSGPKEPGHKCLSVMPLNIPKHVLASRLSQQGPVTESMLPSWLFLLHLTPWASLRFPSFSFPYSPVMSVMHPLGSWIYLCSLPTPTLFLSHSSVPALLFSWPDSVY